MNINPAPAGFWKPWGEVEEKEPSEMKNPRLVRRVHLTGIKWGADKSLGAVQKHPHLFLDPISRVGLDWSHYSSSLPFPNPTHWDFLAPSLVLDWGFGNIMCLHQFTGMSADRKQEHELIKELLGKECRGGRTCQFMVTAGATVRWLAFMYENDIEKARDTVISQLDTFALVAALLATMILPEIQDPLDCEMAESEGASRMCRIHPFTAAICMVLCLYEICLAVVLRSLVAQAPEIILIKSFVGWKVWIIDGLPAIILVVAVITSALTFCARLLQIPVYGENATLMATILFLALFAPLFFALLSVNPAMAGGTMKLYSEVDKQPDVRSDSSSASPEAPESKQAEIAPLI
eukprot:g33934.t1